MKRLMAILLAAVQLLCLCACGNGEAPSTTAPGAEPIGTTSVSTGETTEPENGIDHTTTDVYQLDKWFKNVPTAKMVGVTAEGKEYHIEPAEGYYNVMQGCATDGKYMYALLEKKKQDVDGEVRSLCRIVKTDLATWEIVAVSEPLKVDHGNGMTYNSKTNELLVTNCQFVPKTISVVDPDSLTVTRTVDIKYGARGIAYNAEKDQYAVVVSGSSDIVIYDANFKELDYYKCEKPGLGNQSVSWDGKYLYLTYTAALDKKTKGSEIICCYDWSGNFCGVFRLFCFMEIESSFHYDGKLYASFYSEGGKFYQIDMTGIELLEPKN